MANASTYTDEYRPECADYVISTGRPATEAAEEPGIHGKTLQRRARDRGAGTGGTRAPAPKDAGAEELEKRVREPEQENEFLEKASASFAADQAP